MNTYTKIKHIAGIAALALLSASCGKNFLDKEVSGRISSDMVFKTVEGAKAGMNGIYKLMSDYYANEFTIYGDLAADHVKQGAVSGVPLMANEYNFVTDPEDEDLAVGHIWRKIFETLNNTNNLLGSLPQLKNSFPGAVPALDSLEGQALLVRAMCHFDLSKVYAQTYQFSPDASHLGIPVLLKTPAPGQPVPRKTMRETYAQIINDLTASEKLLRKYSSGNAFAGSYAAVWAIFSRVYLYMGNWDLSVAYADSVIQKTGYVLTSATQYKSMYQSGVPGAEVIWQLYNRDKSNNNLTSAYTLQYVASQKLMSLYDADDIRLQMFRNISGSMATTKYTGTDPIAVDPKVIRLSEVYLNRAEAKWHKNDFSGAAADAKMTAQRSHTNVTVTVPETKDELLGFITDERSRELAFEGHRLYDLARRKEAIVRGADCNSLLCSLPFPNNRFVLPILQSELNANTAMQPNPGIN